MLIVRKSYRFVAKVLFFLMDPILKKQGLNSALGMLHAPGISLKVCVNVHLMFV